MSSLRGVLDKAAIGISIACTLHCLLLLLIPVVLVAAPSAALLAPFDESLHLGLVFLVLPISLIALSLGCWQHREWSILMLGSAGVLVSLGSVLLGHDLLGESGEVVGTIVGAALICVSHVRNQRCCSVG